jgi:hypothetical protein
MDGEVVVGIPVTPEAADMLKDQNRARAVGALISRMLRPASPETDPLAAMIADVKKQARADGLTDQEIDAELAAYNAERRS